MNRFANFSILFLDSETHNKRKTRKNMLDRKHQYDPISARTSLKTAVTVFTYLSKGATEKQDTTYISQTKQEKVFIT
jgi:hypothetical protein